MQDNSKSDYKFSFQQRILILISEMFAADADLKTFISYLCEESQNHASQEMLP